MKTTSWSFDHYCTYVMLCFASSDHELDEEELKSIQSFLSHTKILDQNRLIQELNTVIKYQTEEEHLEFIEDRFEHFVETEEDFTRLIESVEDLIVADFEVAPKEMELYRKLKKMSRDKFL